MGKIGVLLLRYDAKDGSESHESVITLSALDQASVKVILWFQIQTNIMRLNSKIIMNCTKVKIFYRNQHDMLGVTFY